MDVFFQNFLSSLPGFMWSVVRDGIFMGICVWFVYWIWTTPFSAKIIFADCITRKIISGTPIYKVRYVNIGYRDLFECTRIIKLMINTAENPHGKRMRSTYLEVGDDVTVPVIPGTKKWIDKCKPVEVEFFMNEKTFREFQNPDYYPTEITEKAKNGKLTLDDIFDHYRETKHTCIELYISGDDKKTGRNMFNKEYKLSKIKDGEFALMGEHKFSWYNRFQKFPWTQKKIKAMMSALKTA